MNVGAAFYSAVLLQNFPLGEQANKILVTSRVHTPSTIGKEHHFYDAIVPHLNIGVPAKFYRKNWKLTLRGFF